MSAPESEDPCDKVATKEDGSKEELGSPPEEERQGKEEIPRPHGASLLDFRWLQEKEEEEGSLQEQPEISQEGNSHQGPPHSKTSAGDAAEGLCRSAGGNQEEHPEPRVNEVPPPDPAKPARAAERGPVDHEAYYLCANEEEAPHGDSTGFFPCYRTYEELPRYQPPGRPEDRESGAPRPVRKRIPPTRGQGPHQSPPSPLPAAAVIRKCPQKRKHRGGLEKEQGQTLAGEPKPRLQDQRSLPPNPEEAAGALSNCCYSKDAAGEGKQVRPETERGKKSHLQRPSAGNWPTAKETHSPPPEPRTTPSRLSLRFLVSWVQKVFRKAPTPQPPPQPSTSSGAQVGRPLARRVGRWIAQYRGRIHPQSM